MPNPKVNLALNRITAPEALESLSGFDAVLDARSPGEFALDHLPGALSWPVLDDDERREVGTEYKQIDPFEARKRGAAYVARNIARHLEAHTAQLPRSWRPLVYCWRGGQRSGSLAWFLDQIGFRTTLLAGGYKAFRKAVIEALETLPGRLHYRVVCGKTGTGKTELLQRLRARGAQVLDLEALACHRGSVLGLHPGRPQPSQKAFETALWHQLSRFDPALPVFVESESKKVGNLRVPEALITAMRSSTDLIRVELDDEQRLQWLLRDYAFFFDDLPLFEQQLQALVPLRGREQVGQWVNSARSGDWAGAYRELMLRHYDPGYLDSIARNFPAFAAARPLVIERADGASYDAAAATLWPPAAITQA